MEPTLVVVVDDDRGHEQHDLGDRTTSSVLHGLLVHVDRQSDPLPLVAVGLEHLVEPEVWPRRPQSLPHLPWLLFFLVSHALRTTALSRSFHVVAQNRR